MFTKTLLTIGVVAAMSLSMSGAFAQNYGYGHDYRNDRRDFQHERYDRGGRGEHRGFERGDRGEHRGFERGGRSYGNQNHFASGGHSFGSGGRGHR